MNRIYLKAWTDSRDEADSVNSVEVSFSYDKGGEDIRGRMKPRGYYLTLLVCSVRNGFVSFCPNGKSGYRLIKQVSRKSVKAEAEARRLAYEMLPSLLDALGVRLEEDYSEKIKGVLA